MTRPSAMDAGHRHAAHGLRDAGHDAAVARRIGLVRQAHQPRVGGERVLQQRAVMPRERRRDQHLGPIFTLALAVEAQQIGERQGLHHLGLDADANVAELLEHLVARLVIVFERAGRQFGQRRQRAHGQRVAQGVAGVARQPIAPIEQPRHRSGAFANPLIRPIDHWRFPALPNLP